MKKFIFTAALVCFSTFAFANNPTNPVNPKKAKAKKATISASTASVFNGINTEFDYQLTTTAKGQLIVGLQKTTKGDFEIAVVTATGKKVFESSERNSKGQVYKIDMKNLGKGEYFLSITTDQNVVYKPFVL